jgi:sterol desaturase/sphingolipid hydroxylase (fatty acid hydroxylase superfamily)
VFPAPRSSGSSRLWKVPPLAASLVLLCAAVGSVVLAGVAAVALIPVVFTLAVGLGWLAALLMLGWAAIEGLAALERWFENDPRFHR